MDIAKFVAARKALGLSQQELAKGICTQATISRFEKNGQVPSVKILTKLCQKVGLGLEELFPQVAGSGSAVEKKMEEIEFSLIITQYHEAYQNLLTIDFGNLTEEQQLRFLYLRGFLTLFLGMEPTDALFDFNQILVSTKASENNLFTMLSYTGSGLVFVALGDVDKAEFYFEKVFAEIQSFSPQNNLDLWRALTVLFFSGKFYADQKAISPSNALLRHGLSICRSHHVTYYVARIFLQLALNAITEGESLEKIREYLQDAQSFSKFNNNLVELEILAELQEKYHFC